MGAHGDNPRMTRLVLSTRAMRLHERHHSNILEIRDDRPPLPSESSVSEPAAGAGAGQGAGTEGTGIDDIFGLMERMNRESRRRLTP